MSGLQLSLGPNLAGFTFDPILTGTDLLVVKVLEYIGPDDVAPTPITLQAYTVVPEPAPRRSWRRACLPCLSLAVPERMLRRVDFLNRIPESQHSTTPKIYMNNN